MRRQGCEPRKPLPPVVRTRIGTHRSQGLCSGRLYAETLKVPAPQAQKSFRGHMRRAVGQSQGRSIHESFAVFVLEDAAAVDQVALEKLREAVQGRYLALCQVLVCEGRGVAVDVGILVGG